DTTGKFHIIPHDANETFSGGGGRGPGGGGRGPGGPGGGRGGPPGSGGRVGAGGPPGGGPGRMGGGGGGGGGVTLDPFTGSNDPARPLLHRLLAVPSLRARYASYVKDIATKWLDWNRLQPIVKRYQNLIAHEVEIDTRKLDSYEAFVTGID